MVHTHYDNLKVSRKAPPEVIRAAYKTLAQKHHPDKHQGSIEAIRIMTVINEAYEVISDPIKRKEHDDWIEQQENTIKKNCNITNLGNNTSTSSVTSDNTQPKYVGGVFDGLKELFKLFATGVFCIIIALIIAVFATKEGKVYNTSNASPSEYRQTPSAPSYIRPSLAPNGQAWPATASYVKGFKKLHTDGLSKVTIDNSQNNSDVFVKLVAINGLESYPIRVFFIPAFSQFAINNIRAGLYDIRYRDLDSGSLSKSESFTLQKTETYNGIEYSNVTMTLYKVQSGNMQTYGLSEGEF